MNAWLVFAAFAVTGTVTKPSPAQSRESRRKSRNAPESHPTDRPHTVPGEKERDA